MKTPSFGLAGAAGLASLGLFFGSHLILGLAGWETVILFGVGLVLLAVEAFVLPGFGVAGVLGGLAVVASLVMSMVGRMPTSGDLLTAAGVVMASLAMLGVAVWMLVDRLPATPGWRCGPAPPATTATSPPGGAWSWWGWTEWP
jgi:membrane-bound serine protease (ClpP class)